MPNMSELEKQHLRKILQRLRNIEHDANLLMLHIRELYNVTQFILGEFPDPLPLNEEKEKL